jgi:speckle-type POZ protein
MTIRTTVSTCTAETEKGKHVFEIFDYSKHRGMGHEMLIRSGVFSVGGHDWTIRFYPDGFSPDCRDCISVYLELLGNRATVWASCEVSLVDQTTGLSHCVHKTPIRKFSSGDDSRFAPQTGMFMNRRKFESSAYLRDDHLTIQCIITARKPPRVSATEFLNRIEAPPSNITEQLGKLLDAEEGTDVTFRVGGETFAAHKIVLAMRLPGVTRKIRMTTLTQVRVLNTFTYNVRAQRDCDSLCK